METGVCAVCGKNTNLTSCVLCDNKVCSNCYYPNKCICKACKDGGDTDLGNRSADGKY